MGSRILLVAALHALLLVAVVGQGKAAFLGSAANSHVILAEPCADIGGAMECLNKAMANACTEGDEIDWMATNCMSTCNSCPEGGGGTCFQ